LVDAVPTWTLANHDVDREPTRYGDGPTGLARARAMALAMLALPGAVFLYNGEELGLPNVDLPDEVLQDPVWERSKHAERGRDGCRVPMPWAGDTPPFGFSDNADTWLPMPPEWSTLTVQHEQDDPDSMLHFFRRAVRLRHERAEIAGTEVDGLTADGDVLSFRTGAGVTCVLNTGTQPVALPPGEVLLASAGLVDGRLPADAAAWIG
jgi:alpha-glucosidase